MDSTHDVVVIGGGHNGLVAACYLARAGFKPLILERRHIVGGAAITDEFHPGFTCSTLSHATGPLRREIVEQFGLERYGLRLLAPDVDVFAPAPDGRFIQLRRDPAQSAAEIAHISPRDAAKYVEFCESLGRIGGVLATLFKATPPSIDRPSTSDLWTLLQAGRRFRGLPKKDAYRLLRWGPMAVADLVGEWFETELVRATIASRGIFGTFLGPWSAGSGAMLLLDAATRNGSVGGVFVRGGLGRLTQALAAAATGAGATIRTGAEVSRILVDEGHARTVVLTSGEEIPATAVVSNADPRRTFLGLIDPVHLDPGFVTKVQHYRSMGTTAKVNLALSRLPAFSALASARRATNQPADMLGGRIHIGPEIDYLERAFDDAKYGAFSTHPYLEITIPSLLDPSLAPEGAHVMSIYMQFAPYRLKHGSWPESREALGDTVVKTLAEYAPDLPGAIVGRQVITPLDLEQEYGLSGGHIFHGEMAIDQLYTMRPILGWAQYRTPIGGLYLCGAGTHPGGGVTGSPGANAAREIIKDLKAVRRASR